ncbi:ATP-dependent DNA helicase PIF1-like protein, partial [Tanacetum coccineum]
MVEGNNRLIYDETSYNKDELKEQHQTLYGSLITEQKVNIRLGSGSTESGKKKEIQDFADWILDIGNGKIGGKNKGESIVVFSDRMLILEFDDYVGSIINETYPYLLQNIWNPVFFQERVILAPTHEMVDMINERMLDLILGDKTLYESSDFVSLADADTNFDKSIYTTYFLNGIRMSGLPHHAIKLNIGTPVMLMRNIDQKAVLCNRTRLQVLIRGINVTEAKIIPGGNISRIFAIPRMVITPSDTKMPFKLNRRQFPVQVCFGMTINKSQCQTLSQMSSENGVNTPAPNPSPNSSFSLLSVLRRERLTSPNYMDRMRNLRFTLRWESLNMAFDAELSINIILSGLPADYNQFVLSYQMNGKETSIMELHSLLQTTKQGIKKSDVPSTSAAPVLIVGHNVKKRKTSHSNWKGKEVVCFYCNTKGHWKRSCPKYPKDLKDGKVEKGGHS